MQLFRTSRWIAPLIGAMLIAGCAKKPAQAPEETTPIPAEPPKGDATEVEEAVTGSLEVFIPCAFAPPTKKIVEAFQEKYPEVEVTKRVENVEVLAPRIEKGAKPDVFMCVGDIEMDHLQDGGLVEDRRDFCFVSLALVVHESDPLGIESLKDLAKPEVKTVGIGAEGTSPGHYAKEILQELKLWEQVKDKAVFPKFPSQLLKFAGSLKKVDASIAYGACLRAGTGEWEEQNEYQKLAKGLKLVEFLDEGEFCQNIPCTAATVKGCENRAAGKAFIKFLGGDVAQEYFKKSGFTKLSDPKCFK